MARNLDMTALRSFVAVADTGGVTRAAGFLNLTQSAVSMQLKRLEESLDAELLDRTARQIALTPAGEKLLGYARRMLELNDEIWSRLTDTAYEGEIILGVPHDIVYPALPMVLQRFNAEFPRMKVQLNSSYTKGLKTCFRKGECDLILTTEDGVENGGETLKELPLLWIGAPGGTAWRQRPLRLAFGRNCIFRSGVIRRVEAAGIPWELAVESDMDRTIEATVSADLAINAMLEGTEPPHLEQVNHKGTLPELATKKINMYVSETMHGEAGTRMADLLRQAYAQM
ncbi:LysR family transcriptional regulator [Donghicola tyrosinivorans]|uniref:DNA-binding transcriptional LysR family regulator n=1 Tax=Donghicola tyrosinivorans TaxID=1652492 RepID=A0A2T0X4Y3_9RHOB|nr:LysR family transcriptional regulator [Donghicola tyrosinivorans]PRY93914.1 DNA-binding transcriptional LysR family regulator [Donghicola tyrosinivorans]